MSQNGVYSVERKSLVETRYFILKIASVVVWGTSPSNTGFVWIFTVLEPQTKRNERERLKSPQRDHYLLA